MDSHQRALAYNVVLLDAEGNFNPKAEISRADAVEQIFCSALEYIKAHPAPPADEVPAVVPDQHLKQYLRSRTEYVG